MAGYISTKNKSQIWGIDFMIAILIFTGALILFYKYSINSLERERKDVDDLLLDARLISNYLVSAGLPKNWGYNEGGGPIEPTLIGLTNGSMDLIGEKVEAFNTLSTANYDEARNLLSTYNDFYVFFEDEGGSAVNIGGVSAIGETDCRVNTDPEDIIKVFRFVNYQSKIIRMGVCIW